VFRGGAGAEECGGWGYGGVEVVVGDGDGGEGERGWSGWRWRRWGWVWCCEVLASYASTATEWWLAPLWLWVSIGKSVLGRFVGTKCECML